MTTVKRIFLSFMTLMIISINVSLVLAGDDSCCGYISQGNPFYCYDKGNCVWWVWKMAKDNWGDPLPMRRNARYWAADARSSGYLVDYNPVPGSIAVNTTYTDAKGNRYGHVAWVISVVGDSVNVSEMNYGVGSGGMRNNSYRKSFFDGGFIHEKPGRPSIFGISPNPYWSFNDQDYKVSGVNFSTSNLRVKVTFPIPGSPGSAGSAILSGAQIPYQDSNIFLMKMKVGSSGIWSIQAINADGRESNVFWFYVY